MLLRTLRPVLGQRGSALVLTMIVVVGMVALVSVASDNMFGSYKLSTINLDRQRARFAAETVAALVESRLVELASTPNLTSNELDNLTKEFHAKPDEWWDLRGASYTKTVTTVDPLDPAKKNTTYEYVQPQKGLWINGCSVRWRIEPVRVYAKTLDSAGAVDSAATFTINTELDPAKMLTRRDLTTNKDKLSQDDPGFFHFRIVAEAYTLKDARNGDEQPWAASTATQSVEKSQVHVQAQRVVQLQVVNLFKYALFHAQEGPSGDISLKTGASLTILKGSVHSNASIYICGGEWKGYTTTPRDYHMMACGDDHHNGSVESITLGSASEPIDVVGVQGIFRMSKTANLLRNVEVPDEKEIKGPRDVPISDEKTSAYSVYNLNGDSSISTRHNINGVPFILTKDSRTEGALQSTFNRRVRDQSNGGTVVKTLANIPEMAGRPLEHQQLSSDPVNLDRPLYWNVSYTAKDIDDALDPVRVTAALPVPVADDQDFPGPGSTGSTGSRGDGFHDREAKGFYLERGLFGQGLSAPKYYSAIPDSLNRTGLVIRERPRQKRVKSAFDQAEIIIRPKLLAPYTPDKFVRYKQDYAAYLKGQYVVLFAGRNITEYFFDTIVAATDNANGHYPEQNFIVTEDEFIDHRETSWMVSNYGIKPDNYFNVDVDAGGVPIPYRQNVLTLNVRAIQDFLATTKSSDIDAALDNNLAKTHFNGLIYAHRTRRSNTFHIKNFSKFAWTEPKPDGTNIPFSKYFPGKHYVAPTGASYDDLTDIREGDGPYETTRCAVRIRGGLRVDCDDYTGVNGNDTPTNLVRAKYAAINWDSTGTNADGLSNSGLTIVTPNRCYMWGDFNTTTHINRDGKELTVPCAVFADGITGLSANWQDSVWQDYQTQLYSGKLKTYGNGSRGYLAESTKYITSMVTNNVPMTKWNVTSFGTGGAGEMIYMMENWQFATLVFRGSMVVLNEQRYSKCGHCYMPSILTGGKLNGGIVTGGVGVFETGPVEFKFNTDLLTRDGQPPFSPWGFQVTRVVSTVNVFDN